MANEVQVLQGQVATLQAQVVALQSSVLQLQAVPASEVLTVEDGVHVGWLIGSAFLAVFAIKFLSRAFRGETGGDYGQS